VICECDLEPGNWKDVLDEVLALPQPPCVIVTSRLADDYLWAEALNVGAYDVLAKPFETEEVIRIVSSASRNWRDQYLRTRMPKTRRQHAA
jgi:FixJ family two-component response regulator